MPPRWRIPAVPPFRIWPARAAAFGISLRFAFERELEHGRGFLWLPVLFGMGIAAYFALPREPLLPALALAAAAAVAAAWTRRNAVASFRIAVACAALLAGLAVAKLRTDLALAPVIPGERTVSLTGWIISEEEAPNGGRRLVVRIASMDGVAPRDVPFNVQVTVRARANALAAGDSIALKARLAPPSGPAIPGGYDFSFAPFYARVGAVGFAYGGAHPATIGPPPFATRMYEPLGQLRDAIRGRVESALPGDYGHIAAALIMGDQRGIAEATQDDMRASGLGHILSISGLHLALVAGAVFWVVRALLALSPALALRHPIKKWAAGAALAVATLYLGISGAEVATVRSWVMLVIMLGAVLLDRRALTLRNVALAALLILAFSPESLLSISFQMSFAATIAVIATYETVSRRRRLRLADLRPERGWLSRFRETAGTLLVVSLAAGFAVTPFAAFYFQRVAPLSVVANLATGPAIDFVVMPMALIAVLLMPFGIEIFPLTVMKWGLMWMTAVAAKTADWTAGFGNIAMPPLAALLLMTAGFLWLALWRERWRLAGVVPILIALPLSVLLPRPVALVNEDGTAAAVRGADGRFSLIGAKIAGFEKELWLRADADGRDLTDPGLSAGVVCDTLGCTARLGPGNGTLVALATRPDAVEEDCREAAIVIARFDVPAGCAAHALVIDRRALALGGAHAVYADASGGFSIVTAYPAVRRPFMPPVRATWTEDPTDRGQ
jgi:competence protein ComEC